MNDVEDVEGYAWAETPAVELSIGEGGECRVHDDGVGISIEMEYADDNGRIAVISDFDETQTERLAEAVEAETKQTEIEVETETVGKKRVVAAVFAAGGIGWFAAAAPPAFVSAIPVAAGALAVVLGVWLVVSGLNGGDVMGGGGL